LCGKLGDETGVEICKRNEEFNVDVLLAGRLVEHFECFLVLFGLDVI